MPIVFLPEPISFQLAFSSNHFHHVRCERCAEEISVLLQSQERFHEELQWVSRNTRVQILQLHSPASVSSSCSKVNLKRPQWQLPWYFLFGFWSAILNLWTDPWFYDESVLEVLLEENVDEIGSLRVCLYGDGEYTDYIDNMRGLMPEKAKWCAARCELPDERHMIIDDCRSNLEKAVAIFLDMPVSL